MRQFVVKRTGAGMFWNSFCWLCHAVPKFPLSLGMLFELRIAVGRKHLAMGVDVHALAVGLLEKELEVSEVMPLTTMKGPFSIVMGTVVGTGVPKVSVFALSRSAIVARFFSPISRTIGRSSSMPQSSPTAKSALAKSGRFLRPHSRARTRGARRRPCRGCRRE